MIRGKTPKNALKTDEQKDRKALYYKDFCGLSLLAEKERFELSRRYSRPTPLAGAPLRPLEYFSVYSSPAAGCIGLRHPILYMVFPSLSSPFLQKFFDFCEKFSKPWGCGGFLRCASPRADGDSSTECPWSRWGIWRK